MVGRKFHLKEVAQEVRKTVRIFEIEHADVGAEGAFLMGIHYVYPSGRIEAILDGFNDTQIHVPLSSPRGTDPPLDGFS
jgi:hypothetical protein